jgi:acyl carrier protein
MVLEKVRAVIAEEFDVEEDMVGTETTLEELGADPVDVVELTAALEEEFDLEIPESVSENFSTVGDIVGYIRRNLA